MPFSYNIKQEGNNLQTVHKKSTEDLQKEDFSNLVLDQINRSVAIQSSIMPGFTSNSSMLKDGFLLFEPKNKLSGDFYWSIEQEENLIFVLGDSTGHGIPGAMLSMIAFTVLNSLDYKELFFSPSKIITKIHQALSNNFKNSKKFCASRDGFDLAVVVISRRSSEIKFSGAKRPLILIRENQISEFKGDVKTTGIETPYEHDFEEICIRYFHGDRLYLFSDGFQDQFGGKWDKKFTYKRFKRLLNAFHNRPMREQQFVFGKILDSWRFNYDSTDDVSLLGLELA